MEKFTYDRVIDHLAKFYKMSSGEAKFRCGDANAEMNKYWTRINPRDAKQRHDLYIYLAVNIFAYVQWHYLQCIEGRTKLSTKLKGKVLNYGCGIATESFLAAQDRGIKTHLYDVPGVSPAFVNYMIKEEGLEEYLVYVEELEFEQYDTIVCLDVLEHVEDIDKTCKLLRKHLKEDGTLLVRAPLNWIGKLVI